MKRLKRAFIALAAVAALALPAVATADWQSRSIPENAQGWTIHGPYFFSNANLQFHPRAYQAAGPPVVYNLILKKISTNTVFAVKQCPAGIGVICEFYTPSISLGAWDVQCMVQPQNNPPYSGTWRCQDAD